jgi:hypothetical protein
MPENPSVEIPSADEFLFGGGAKLEDYFLDRSHGFEVLCFIGKDGREFDVRVSNEELFKSAVARLIELGVRIRNG